MREPGERIDWDEVKARLRASQGALEKALAPGPERTEEVYRQRAAQLASRGQAERAPVAALRMLVFELGTERYALPFADLVELLPLNGCAPVPGGPAALLGVTNVHGEIRSVVDLGQLLELPGSESPATGYLVLVRNRQRQAALRVDRLDKILSVLPDELIVPGAEAGVSLRFLRGLTPDGVRLLDTEALLSHTVFQGTQPNRAGLPFGNKATRGPGT